MRSKRDLLSLIGLTLVVAGVTAIGIGARAAYGAQTTADEPQYLLTALSIWEDGNLDISDELAGERYREFHEVDLPEQTLPHPDGRRISPHDPLLPLLLTVPVGIGGWVAAKAFLAVLGGVLAASMAWTMVTRFQVSRRVAFLTAGILALAPPLAVYSTQVYPEIPAALVLLAGFAAVTGPFERMGRSVFLISVIALPWLAVKFVPLAAVLALTGLVRAGKRERRALLGVLVAGGIVYVLGHYAVYGGITAYASGDHFVGGEFTAVGTHANLWGRSSRLIGLLVDRGFGIGVWQPAYLVLPLVAGWAVSRREANLTLAAGLVGIGWLVATFVALTMHGWWFPGRQLVVVLPLAAVVIGSWLHQARPWQRNVVGLTGIVGIVAFVFLLFEGLNRELTWVVDFGTTANPLYRALATVTPEYMVPTATTWALHGFWVSTAVGLGWLGWRSGSHRQAGTASSDPINGHDGASQRRTSAS